MNVTGKTRIFRRDFDGRVSYSRRISSKEYKNGQETGEWINDWENVQFPKGTEIPDKTDVEIEGFEAVFRTRNGEIKRKLVVTKYNILSEIQQTTAQATFDDYDDIPY